MLFDRAKHVGPCTDEEFVREYRRRVHGKIVFAAICIVMAIVVFFITLSVGRYDISAGEAYRIFIDHLMGRGGDSLDDTVIWEMWAPRAIMAVFVGAALAVGGAVMQNLLTNPLAEPYTMGISSGAFLGAVLSLTCGISIIPFLSGDDAIVANAFLFSLIPVLMITLISKYRKTTSSMMILCGISIMYIFSAISTLLMVLADPTHLSDAYTWRVGSLGRVEWNDLALIVPSVTALIFILMLLSTRMNALSTGDRGASSLGVDPYRTRLICMVLVAVLTAFAVSFTGTIGFVGLVCPHIVRVFIGSNNRYLLPACAGFGALFLVFMDSLSKVITSTGLPVGVVTAFIGGPLFIYILIQRRRKVWF